MNRIQEIVFFGKPGSFTHTVAQKISRSQKLVSQETIRDVLDYVKKSPHRQGIIPIENTSGGMVPDTIDNLMSKQNSLVILDEYALNVKLHLLARKGTRIQKIYSHFMPFHHCQKWLKKYYPRVTCIPVESTSQAAQRAFSEEGTAAIAQERSAKEYKLQMIRKNIGDYPLNITQFYRIGHPTPPSPKATETSLCMILKDEVGSLHEALSIFSQNKVNLRRIMSRPVPGKVNQYIFFLSVEASTREPQMKKALLQAKKIVADIRILGCYPVHAPFES